MFRTLALCTPFLLVAAVSGCKDDKAPSSSDGAPHETGADGVGTDTGTDASSSVCPNVPSLLTSDGSCNAVSYPSLKIPFSVGTGTAPAFTGGTLVDGLYTAIKTESWATTTGSGRQLNMVVLNGGTKLLYAGQTLNADGTGDFDAGTPNLAWIRANYDVSGSGNQLTVTQTCHAGNGYLPTTFYYTATSTNPPQILVGLEDGPVVTYERQGCPTAP